MAWRRRDRGVVNVSAEPRYYLFRNGQKLPRNIGPATPSYGEVVVQMSRTSDILLKGWRLDNEWVGRETRAGVVLRRSAASDAISHVRDYVDEVYVERNVLATVSADDSYLT